MDESSCSEPSPPTSARDATAGRGGGDRLARVYSWPTQPGASAVPSVTARWKRSRRAHSLASGVRVARNLGCLGLGVGCISAALGAAYGAVWWQAGIAVPATLLAFIFVWAGIELLIDRLFVWLSLVEWLGVVVTGLALGMVVGLISLSLLAGVLAFVAGAALVLIAIIISDAKEQ